MTMTIPIYFNSNDMLDKFYILLLHYWMSVIRILNKRMNEPNLPQQVLAQTRLQDIYY